MAEIWSSDLANMIDYTTSNIKKDIDTFSS